MIKARAGSWNGLSFTGHGLRPNPVFEYEFVLNEKEVYYDYKLLDTVFSRLVLNPSGIAQRFVWMDRTHSWEPFFSTAKIMRYAVDMLSATSISLLYVHAWKDSYPSLQKIGIRQIGLMGVFVGLLWNAMTEMDS